LTTGEVKRVLLIAVAGLITAFVTYQLTWRIPQLSYRIQPNAMGRACSAVKPGMDRASAVEHMERTSLVNLESEIPNGLYFYGNGSCEITIENSTNKVTQATFKGSEPLGTAK
jgi:hypothetical protein